MILHAWRHVASGWRHVRGHVVECDTRWHGGGGCHDVDVLAPMVCVNHSRRTPCLIWQREMTLEGTGPNCVIWNICCRAASHPSSQQASWTEPLVVHPRRAASSEIVSKMRADYTSAFHWPTSLDVARCFLDTRMCFCRLPLWNDNKWLGPAWPGLAWPSFSGLNEMAALLSACGHAARLTSSLSLSSDLLVVVVVVVAASSVRHFASGDSPLELNAPFSASRPSLSVMWRPALVLPAAASALQCQRRQPLHWACKTDIQR